MVLASPRWLIPVALALVGACSARQSTVRPDERFVEVENRRYADVNVYVVEGTRRMRLGVAPGLTSTRLKLPRSVSSGTRVLRFQLDPIGGSRQSLTQDLTVGPGVDIQLIIPP
jgi:hypothetical protein